MARTRHARPELTESWDDVGNGLDGEEPIYNEDEERREPKDSYYEDTFSTPSNLGDGYERRPRKALRGSKVDIANGDAGPRSRRPRPSVEPELVMPSSPDTARSKGKLRASTPHFRLNERSLTSDAGKLNGSRAKLRASTPHYRMNQRSLTSDAGKFGSRLREEVDDDDRGDAISYPSAAWVRIIQPLLAYCGDIVGNVLQNLKPLLGYALLAYLLVGVAIFGVNFVTSSINNALTPICRIPGASWLNLPFCPASIKTGAGELQGPVEFDKLVVAQSQFEEVLASTSLSANLPLDMKRSEASIRDLKHVVQYSTLPSRNELVFEFGGFIDTARQASQDLSRFNSRIGRAVDHILSTNRWTLSVIDGVAARDASQGSMSKWLGDNLNIFAPFQPVSLSKDVLLDQYLRHTNAVEDQILSLISEAQALLNILDNLDARLDVVASIAARDGVKVQDNKEELFAYLWTKLGGNRSSVTKLEQQMKLLKDVGSYRRLAWAHVTTTIVKLQAIRDTLEDLRERVAMPETVGTDKIPLEVHIESITLGIERLEQQRDSSRRSEAENYARVISRAEEGDKRMIGAGEL